MAAGPSCPPPVSLGALLDMAASRLRRSGADAPALTARLLAQQALALPEVDVLTRRERPIAPAEEKSFLALLERRLAGEPTAYILGRREFYGRDFAVAPGVLIPRPETELLVELALDHAARQPVGRFADLGTGSGCLAVTLALELPAVAHGLALDASRTALFQARNNALRLGAAPRLQLLWADFRRPWAMADSCQLVVANPPYVTTGEYTGLDPMVRDHEPAEALLAGEDGLDALRGLLPGAALALAPGGLLLCEIGAGQGATAPVVVERSGNWRDVALVADLAGHPRVVRAVRAG